ncbi:insulin-like peptide receptor [Teleopsis dalmanni]|uniref:insulin-like peptide receptor n=1 Tax=Teleopsis dalmanni TaxID=139649 RepID=UPI0018CFBDD7|nr:insulin-like peptide receptor [Teleopsis dalmanni]
MLLIIVVAHLLFVVIGDIFAPILNYFVYNRKFLLVAGVLALLRMSAVGNVELRDGDQGGITLGNTSLIMPHECTSIDVRNDCDSLLQLEGCVVIKGFLIIALLPKMNGSSYETCNYTQYRFTQLREISDFLIFFDVKGLTSIRDMFPNLTVIRGRRLFLNYALGISKMPDLEMIEFKSLVAIQRGNVFIGSSPKLCQLERINWDRLTVSPGENHIFPIRQEKCPRKSECAGCDSQYCWSDFVCQKFENDNVIYLRHGTRHCHEQCLGGCSSTTNEGCAVCKGFLDHNSCVSQCPSDLIALEHYQRCYTKAECTKFSMAKCPDGFYYNKTHINCEPCGAETETEFCIKNCTLGGDSEVFEIFHLSDVDTLKGCETVSGSIIINLKNSVNELDLESGFAGITEIGGFLKVHRSFHLTSLKFLKNLKKIKGKILDTGDYALVIYDNKNLKELWNSTNLSLENGSIYIQSNNKLCNQVIQTFTEKITHDHHLDSIQNSDQKVLCGFKKLMLYVNVTSHQSIEFEWLITQTSNETEILYKYVPHGERFDEESEFDSNICDRINWQKYRLLNNELDNNGTHYRYVVTNLKQNTNYACLIKTFGGTQNTEARSDLKFITTNIFIPTTPKIITQNKTDTSLTIKLIPQNSSLEVVRFYELELYEFLDDTTMLDKRNFCNQPTYLYKDMPIEAYTLASVHTEDFDDCCLRSQEKIEDQHFISSIHKMYDYEYCEYDCLPESSNYSSDIPLRKQNLTHDNQTYTFNNLERFRLYSLQVKACNEIGCSTFGIHADRTNYSVTGDMLEDLKACRILGTTTYVVNFEEPKNPNGRVVAYIIHYRIYKSGLKNYLSHINCISRLQHVQSNYQNVAYLNETFTEVAVRVLSLGTDVLTSWYNITDCSQDMSDHFMKLAGIHVTETHQSHGINIFLLFFFIGASGTVIWICYKRRIWQKFPNIRRYFLTQRNMRIFPLSSDDPVEDRQILVDGFETVRFRNNPDDDQKYIE